MVCVWHKVFCRILFRLEPNRLVLLILGLLRGDARCSVSARKRRQDTASIAGNAVCTVAEGAAGADPVFCIATRDSSGLLVGSGPACACACFSTDVALRDFVHPKQ